MTSAIDQTPRVSIVVPTSGDGQFLLDALESIEAQGRTDFEVIVVDDASPDPVAPRVVERLPAARTARLYKNAGPSAARNKGIALARGDFVAFLDDDDLWTKNALSRMLETFYQAPDADIVHGYLRRFRVGHEGWEYLSPAFCGFNVGATMVRKKALLDIGGFDESLRRSEDVDLMFRLSDAGAKRVVIPDHLVNYRWHERHGGLEKGHALVPRANGNWMNLLRQSLARKKAAASPTKKARSREPVTVLLTVRNGRRHLPDAVACLRSQTHPADEILACVGASIDGTLEYLRDQTGIRVLEQTGLGLAQARNEALSHASHPWITFLDHDDIWHPEKLAKQLDAVLDFNCPCACIANFLNVTADMSFSIDSLPRMTDLPTLGWTPSALLAHRDVFAKVGSFDPNLGMGCDADWFDRLRRLDIPCTVAGRVLLWKRRHPDSLSADTTKNRAAMFQVIRKRRLAEKAQQK